MFEKLEAEKRPSLGAQLTTLTSAVCDPPGPYCAASRVNLFDWAKDWLPILLSTVVLAALFAWVCANNIADWVARYWSFEARFTRRLNAQSIAVVYQPLVDLKTDDVVGVEERAELAAHAA